MTTGIFVPHLLRIALVSLLIASGLVVAAPGAHAERIPETLADRQPVGPGAVAPPFSMDFVGVFWDVPAGIESHAHASGDDHGHADAPHGEIRLRHGDRWGQWAPLVEDGAQMEGRWTGSLVPAGDADAYQLRGVPADAVRPQAVAINTTDGPAQEIRTRPASAQALPPCVSRYDWGADESLRTSNRDFADVQVMTVHHTATSNDDSDPKATVRAIYRYHTVDNGWDDIGYQYLVDEQGRLYEGRWSGADSEPCESDPPAPGVVGETGDGRDFAHNELNQLVTGAHTGGYNTGNVGVALLGDFRDHPRFGAEPTEAAVTSLEDTLAGLADRHEFTRQQLAGDEKVDYDNGVNQATVDAISAHRDFTATECPGQRLYDQLPAIRDSVAQQAGSDDEDPVEEPVPASLHVGGMDDVSTDGPGPHWDATVSILVHDEDHSAADNVSVSGSWQDGASAACTTGGDGTCLVSTRLNGKKTTSTTFTVEDVSRGGDTYDRSANHDPAGDEPTITVSQS